MTQVNDELMAMTLPREARQPAADEAEPPDFGAAARRRASIRTALILASIAATFFVGIIVKFALLGA